MITYLTLYFNSEGESPRKVTSVLKDLGFEAIRGVHDYTFDWGKRTKPDVHEILDLLEKLHKALNGLNVQYQVTTL
jgi:hypothetical protein